MNTEDVHEQELLAHRITEDDHEARTHEQVETVRREARWQMAELAGRRVTGAMNNAQKFLSRAAAATTTQEQSKLEAQSLAAMRRSTEWAAMETELRTGSVRVSEPSPYSEGSPHSYYVDLMHTSLPTHQVDGATRRQAQERIDRHGRDLLMEAASPATRAAKAIRNAVRSDVSSPAQTDMEVRAVSTSTAGALAAPAYLTTRWAKFRSAVPAMSLACTQVPLPDHGMTVSVPAVTSGSTVAAATENASVSEADLSGAYRQASLVILSGYAEVSQALVDRTGPGVAFDDVVHGQLSEVLEAQQDLLAFTAMTTSATATRSRSSAATLTNLWSDLASIGSSLETASGAYLDPSHAFIPPATFRFYASTVGSDGRPVWLPDGNRQSDPTVGDSGFSVAGTRIFLDANIPASGSDAQIVVANPASTLFLAGEPVLSVIPSEYAQDLSVIIRVYTYALAIALYPATSAGVISGAGYAASPTFA